MTTSLDLPDYCCAILRAPDGQLLLEWRGPDARHAPGLITCLGGAREAGEEPEACLRRELIEEIGWAPNTLERAAVLRVDGVLSAWFYRGRLSVSVGELRPEPGLKLVLLARGQLASSPVHPWHRAVLEAEQEGRDLVAITAPTGS